jgi:predicted nucleotidyltransferase
VANSSLDLSDRAVLGSLARLLSSVRRAADDTPLLLVGAAARDILLVHARGVAMQRATEDTDLALAVRDWKAFLHVRKALLELGTFTAEGPAHRLWFGDQRLDIMPFGGVERPDRSIAWPPEGVEVMNVRGLTEALATAVVVRLPGGVSIDVACLPALALLKIWAWEDRKYTTPGKDASDLWMFLRHHAEAGNEDRLYDQESDGLASFAFDLEKAGAWLLGKDALDVLAHGPDPRGSLETLDAILRPEIDPDGALRLVAQMPPDDRDRQVSLLAAFHAGLFKEPLPRRPGGPTGS